MKRLFTLAALALILNSAIAQTGSILNLRLSDHTPFTMYLDGAQAGVQGSVARIEQMAPGRHYVQVFRTVNSWGYTSMESLYSGLIDIPVASEMFSTIDVSNHMLLQDQVVALMPAYPTNVNRLRDRYNPSRNPQRPVICEPTVVVQQQPAYCGPVVMDNYSFQQLKSTISNSSFESTKLTIFKQALAYNYFSTAQVKELMCLFTFDSYRLDVAKLAYNKTVDQQNYFIVNNAFTFSSNVYDLNNYIASL